MLDPLTPASAAPGPTFLQGDALASALVGLQDQLRTGKMHFECIDGDGYIALLFGGVVSARFQDEVGAAAILAMLAAPPGKVTIESVFEVPEGQELAAPSVSLAELVDRWRRTAAPSIPVADEEELSEEPVSPSPAGEVPVDDAPLNAPEPTPNAEESNPFDIVPDEADVDHVPPRPLAFPAKPSPEADDPLAYGSALFDQAWMEDEETSGRSGADRSEATPDPPSRDALTAPLVEEIGEPTESSGPDESILSPRSIPFSQTSLPPVLATAEPLFLPLPAGLPSDPSSSPCPPVFGAGAEVRVWVERERFTGVLSFGAPESLRLYSVQGRVLGVETVVDGALVLGARAAHAGVLAMHGRRVVGLRYETGLATALAAISSEATPLRQGQRISYPCREVIWPRVQSASPDHLAILALSAGSLRMVAWREPENNWQFAAAGGVAMLDLTDLEAAWQFDEARFTCQYLDRRSLRPLFESTLPVQDEPITPTVPAAPPGKRRRTPKLPFRHRRT